MYCPNKITYVIKRGDTLYMLARQFNTSVDMIAKLNPSIDPYNLRVGSSVVICPNDEFETENGSFDDKITISNDMRLAWLQHVYWTRMYIISALGKLSDLAAVTERLMQNPKVIADIFAENFRPLDAVNIENLLAEHLKIGGELVVAVRDNDMKGADELSVLWYKNADMIAQTLHNINPSYDAEKLRKMLYSHLDMTLQETALRLAKKHREEIEVFNNIEQEILFLSDYLTSGLTRVSP